MKTILMVSPNAMDGVSLYRHSGPMTELERQGHVRLIYMNSDKPQEITHWQLYRKVDLCFLNRSSRLDDEAIIKECLKYNIPMWQDLDDNVFELPDDNPAKSWYTGKALEILKFGLLSAKKVTVATPRLKTYLETKDTKSEVIPNALFDQDLHLREEFSFNKRVVWRGSDAGKKDLFYYTKRNQISAHYMGVNPFWLDVKYSYAKPSNYIDYLKDLSMINPSFMFFTHLDGEFHATKSHNGWLEGTLCGAVCLVPNLGDWVGLSDEMVFKYTPMNEGSFFNSFKKMTESSENKLKEMNNNSWNYIVNNLLLSHINQKRLKIIEDLTNGQKR